MDIYGSGDKFLNNRVEFTGQWTTTPASSIDILPKNSRLLKGWWTALKSFGKAFYYGGWLCLTYREFVWLIPSESNNSQSRERFANQADLHICTGKGYTLALYGHRYLENGILQMYAKTILGRSSLVQIMVGG